MKFKDWLLEKGKDDDDDFLKRFRKLDPEAGTKKKKKYGGVGFIDPKSPGARKVSKKLKTSQRFRAGDKE